MLARTMPSKPPKPERPNLLTEVSSAAERTLLLATLRACEWNLTRTAEALGLSQPTEVRRAIVRLDLTADLEAAKSSGLARPGNPHKRSK